MHLYTSTHTHICTQNFVNKSKCLDTSQVPHRERYQYKREGKEKVDKKREQSREKEAGKKKERGREDDRFS